jgi:hypothetical protein
VIAYNVTRTRHFGNSAEPRFYNRDIFINLRGRQLRRPKDKRRPSSSALRARITNNGVRSITFETSRSGLGRETAALRDFSPPFVRFGSQADVTPSLGHVRFAPKADKRADVSLSPLSATSRHMQRSK